MTVSCVSLSVIDYCSLNGLMQHVHKVHTCTSMMYKCKVHNMRFLFKIVSFSPIFLKRIHTINNVFLENVMKSNIIWRFNPCALSLKGKCHFCHVLVHHCHF